MLARPVAVAALALLSLTSSEVLAQEQSETRQSATIGVPFEIALPANPSTGYQWRIDTSASSNLQNVKIEDLGTVRLQMLCDSREAFVNGGSGSVSVSG